MINESRLNEGEDTCTTPALLVAIAVAVQQCRSWVSFPTRAKTTRT